jgi:hypothetical protein
MTLCYLGDADKLIQSGGGKLSIPQADTGDVARKPKGQG